MKETYINGFEDGIAQAIEEIKSEQGNNFSLDKIAYNISPMFSVGRNKFNSRVLNAGVRHAISCDKLIKVKP